jgi:hypothetical protein
MCGQEIYDQERATSGMVRKSGKWMSVWDDRILETLQEDQVQCLPPIEIYNQEHILVSKPQVVRRLQTLEEHGLVEGDGGYYLLTDRGRQYLSGEVDVSE